MDDLSQYLPNLISEFKEYLVTGVELSILGVIIFSLRFGDGLIQKKMQTEYTGATGLSELSLPCLFTKLTKETILVS